MNLNDFILFMQKNWGWLLSFVTVVGGGIVYVIVRLHAMELGVQALLRDRMISNWYTYSAHGSAPMYVRQSFENLWIQYEKLGKNGVMEDLHKKFMALPIDNEKGAVK